MNNQLSFAKTTNVGGRSVNEDSIGIFAQGGKIGLVLCDGLGGHGLGDVASHLTVATFGNELCNEKNTKKALVKSFENAQKNILQEQEMRAVPNKIKTTAVMAVIDKNHVHIGHIGDSRLYIFKDNKVAKRTLDHSIPQMLALSKDISDAEIRHHPDRNLLLRVIGTQWQGPQYELMKPIPLRKIQAMLLCSDGFWELIDEDCMCQCLKAAATVQEWLDAMTRIVEINGEGHNMDNFSAIAVWNEGK